jgi:hypothetical protein
MILSVAILRHQPSDFTIIFFDLPSCACVMLIIKLPPAPVSGLLPLHDAQEIRVAAEMCGTGHIQAG